MPRAPSRSSCAPSSPSGPCVAARIMPPPARCSRIRSASMRLRRGVERRGRLVEQPERPLAPRSAARSTAAAAGRPRDRRPAGRRCRRGRRASSARPRRRRRRRDSASRSRGFPRPSATASARPGGRDSAPARRCVASGSPPSSASRPPASRTRPATSRSSDDLPAPFGPVTSSASPAPTAKLRPGKHPPAAPDAGQVGGQKPHRPPNRLHQGLLPSGRRAAGAGRPKPAVRIPWKSGISGASC